jgi:hypothetical protein
VRTEILVGDTVAPVIELDDRHLPVVERGILRSSFRGGTAISRPLCFMHRGLFIFIALDNKKERRKWKNQE